MAGSCWLCVVTIWTILGLCLADFTLHNMVDNCNKDMGEHVSGRLETSSALHYDRNMDCWTTIGVETGKVFFLDFRRFVLEETVGGVCVDALTIYEGSTTTSPVLFSETCGTIDSGYNLTSTGNKLTFKFFSDNTAVLRGFEIVYVAVSPPPCASDEFECGSGTLCIDSSLKCDDENQCGDGSDEAGCDDEAGASSAGGLPLGLIIGCSVAGVVLLIILVVVAWRVYTYYYWKNWLKRNQTSSSQDLHEADLYSYPKTDKYQVYEIGKKGRREPQVSEYFSEEKTYYEQSVKAEELTRYLDEK